MKIYILRTYNFYHDKFTDEYYLNRDNAEAVGKKLEDTFLDDMVDGIRIIETNTED